MTSTFLNRYIPPFKMNDAFSSFRMIAFFEGSSYVLLLFTMILKYRFDIPEPNLVVGMAHGVLFIAYVLILLFAARQKRWGLGKISLAFILSLVPFGTFYGEGHVWGRD